MSVRDRYEPPDPGIAAPNAAQTNPSHITSAAPKTQPKIACGPAIAAMMSGSVMKGPTPIISIRLSIVAPPKPMARTSCGSRSTPPGSVEECRVSSPVMQFVDSFSAHLTLEVGVDATGVDGRG